MTILSSPWTLLCAAFVAGWAELADFYAESAAQQRQDRDRLVRTGSVASFAVALVVGTVWTHPVTFYRGETSDDEQVCFCVKCGGVRNDSER